MFARWARRKAQVAREETEEKQEVEPDAAELAANRAAAEAVDLDRLGPDSDLRVFLRRGVPETLKNQALRAVWRSDPVFANLDGMVDYGEDFGRKDLILKTFTSAWQAGRGYLDKVAEAAETPQPPEPTGETEAAEAPAPAPSHPADRPGIEVARDEAQAPDTPPKVSLRRRMGV